MNTNTANTNTANTGTAHTDPADTGTEDRLPLTHEEWSAFAALPPTERADFYIRALRSMTAVVATLAVAGPVAVVILAMPGIRGLAHDWRPAAMALLGR
ncbi:MAG TPA: hypothetical protein VFU73_06890 [Actinocrinis sp.]|nr:hypothetical protein [Actinocrinis sp.]